MLEDRQDRFELIGCRQLLLGCNVRCGVWCLLVLVCLEGGVDVISLIFLPVTYGCVECGLGLIVESLVEVVCETWLEVEIRRGTCLLQYEFSYGGAFSDYLYRVRLGCLIFLVTVDLDTWLVSGLDATGGSFTWSRSSVTSGLCWRLLEGVSVVRSVAYQVWTSDFSGGGNF